MVHGELRAGCWALHRDGDRMIKFTGIRNNRPQLEMDADTERANRGCFPKWVIKAMDDKRIRMEGSELLVGSRRLSIGASFAESDAG